MNWEQWEERIKNLESMPVDKERRDEYKFVLMELERDLMQENYESMKSAHEASLRLVERRSAQDSLDYKSLFSGFFTVISVMSLVSMILMISIGNWWIAAWNFLGFIMCTLSSIGIYRSDQ